QLLEGDTERKVDAFLFVTRESCIIQDVLNVTLTVLFRDEVPHRLSGERRVGAGKSAEFTRLSRLKELTDEVIHLGGPPLRHIICRAIHKPFRQIQEK